MTIAWPVGVNQRVIDQTTIKVGEGGYEEDEANNGIQSERRLTSLAIPDKFSVVMDFDWLIKDSDGNSEWDLFVRWYKYSHKRGVNPFIFPSITRFTVNGPVATCRYRITSGLSPQKSGFCYRVTMDWEEVYTGGILIEPLTSVFNDKSRIDHVESRCGNIAIMYKSPLTRIPEEYLVDYRCTNINGVKGDNISRGLIYKGEGFRNPFSLDGLYVKFFDSGIENKPCTIEIVGISYKENGKKKLEILNNLTCKNAANGSEYPMPIEIKIKSSNFLTVVYDNVFETEPRDFVADITLLKNGKETSYSSTDAVFDGTNVYLHFDANLEGNDKIELTKTKYVLYGCNKTFKHTISLGNGSAPLKSDENVENVKATVEVIFQSSNNGGSAIVYITPSIPLPYDFKAGNLTLRKGEKSKWGKNEKETTTETSIFVLYNNKTVGKMVLDETKTFDIDGAKCTMRETSVTLTVSMESVITPKTCTKVTGHLSQALPFDIKIECQETKDEIYIDAGDTDCMAYFDKSCPFAAILYNDNLVNSITNGQEADFTIIA